MLFRDDEPEAPALMALLAGEAPPERAATPGEEPEEGGMTPAELAEQESILSMYGVFQRFDKDDSGFLDAKVGFGRIVALDHRTATLYQIYEQIWQLCF